jgi:hypothetical protein
MFSGHVVFKKQNNAIIALTPKMFFEVAGGAFGWGR